MSPPSSGILKRIQLLLLLLLVVVVLVGIGFGWFSRVLVWFSRVLGVIWCSIFFKWVILKFWYFFFGFLFGFLFWLPFRLPFLNLDILGKNTEHNGFLGKYDSFSINLLSSERRNKYQQRICIFFLKFSEINR